MCWAPVGGEGSVPQLVTFMEPRPLPTSASEWPFVKLTLLAHPTSGHFQRGSFKASNKGCVVCDHPGELRPRIRVGENCVKILFNRRRSFAGDPPLFS